MDQIGRERGWPPMTRAQFEAGATLEGHNVIGSPEQVIEKILYQHQLFQHDRFLLQMSVGTLPHDALMHAIELYGTVVAPAVRAELSHCACRPVTRSPREGSRGATRTFSLWTGNGVNARVAQVAADSRGRDLATICARAACRASAIAQRVAAGRLFPLYRGVFAIGHANLAFDAWCLAAVKACGPARRSRTSPPRCCGGCWTRPVATPT